MYQVHYAQKLINMYLLFATITHHERQVSHKHTTNKLDLDCFFILPPAVLVSKNITLNLGLCVSVFPALKFLDFKGFLQTNNISTLLAKL